MKTTLRIPKTILFPVDLSPHSASAASVVSDLARQFQSRVALLYVLEPLTHPFEMFSEGMRETRSRTEIARAKVEEFAKRELKGIPCDLRVEEGNPAGVIDRVSGETDADLICMPTRGHGPFRRFLLGSVTAKVLNDVKVPVLTGAHLDRPLRADGLRLGQLICAFSLDDRGKAALEGALLLCQIYEPAFTVVHAIERQNTYSAADVESSIKDIVGARTAKIVIEPAEPARLVSKVAAESDADLVVIGRSTPGPLGRLRTQSYAIIRESPCAVLSI